MILELNSLYTKIKDTFLREELVFLHCHACCAHSCYDRGAVTMSTGYRSGQAEVATPVHTPSRGVHPNSHTHSEVSTAQFSHQTGVHPNSHTHSEVSTAQFSHQTGVHPNSHTIQRCPQPSSHTKQGCPL